VGRSVVAEESVIGASAAVGAANARHPVLIGAKRRVRAGAELAPGSELEPSRPRDLLQTVQ
jgi:hypothetical protein